MDSEAGAQSDSDSPGCGSCDDHGTDAGKGGGAGGGAAA